MKGRGEEKCIGELKFPCGVINERGREGEEERREGGRGAEDDVRPRPTSPLSESAAAIGMPTSSVPFSSILLLLPLHSPPP